MRSWFDLSANDCQGREQRFMIYELIGIAGSDDPELRPVGDAAKLSEMTRSASGLFQAGDYPAASNAYRRILDRYPSDEVAKSMLEMPEFAADGAGVR